MLLTFTCDIVRLNQINQILDQADLKWIYIWLSPVLN